MGLSLRRRLRHSPVFLMELLEIRAHLVQAPVHVVAVAAVSNTGGLRFRGAGSSVRGDVDGCGGGGGCSGGYGDMDIGGCVARFLQEVEERLGC